MIFPCTLFRHLLIHQVFVSVLDLLCVSATKSLCPAWLCCFRIDLWVFTSLWMIKLWKMNWEHSFLLFSLFLYFFILNNSLILFRIPEFYGLRLACLQIYLMKTPQSFSCFHSIALNRQQKNIFNGWSHHRISASYWKS